MGKRGILEKFAVMVSAPDSDINLAGAALAIARNEYPDLDISAYLQRLRLMTDELRQRVLGCNGVRDTVSALNGYLFDELGFSGNLSDFNDPRNSFLNDVLDRKLGIPISLSVIYMELGRCLGLPVSGVSFPGHFLVKINTDAGDLVLDPFSGGISLDRQELEQRLEHSAGTKSGNRPLEELLRPAGNKQILARVLRNLKTIYLDAEDYARALDMVNFALALSPGKAAEIRDRAFIYDQMNCYRAAMVDYQDYLMVSHGPEDAPYVKTRIADLKLTIRRLH